MGVKRPADADDDSGEGSSSKAKVANLKKLEEEAKQHERDNPQQGTSRQMQGKVKGSVSPLPKELRCIWRHFRSEQGERISLNRQRRRVGV